MQPPPPVSLRLLVSQVRGQNAKVEKDFFFILLSNCFVKSDGVETGRRNVSSGLF